jgi:hypothetical protein
MSAIHIDFIFGEYKQKQEDKSTEAAQEESALVVAMENRVDEPLNDKECDDAQGTLVCSPKEKSRL